MKKILVSSLVAVVALSANVAAAQSYYPTYSYTPTYQTQTQTQYQQPYIGGCINLMWNLSFGSRGTEVRKLQTFLVSRNYPGGGSWMITGYFGRATQAAVRNFQMEQGLSPVGIVGPMTRAAIARVSCGGTGYNPYPYPTPPTYTYPPTTPPNNTTCYYTYPYICPPFNNYQNVTLTSLSVTSGQPGSSVTIYGSNFDYANNTVYFGTMPIANVSSYNGTSLTVTVPSTVSQNAVNVYVTNTRGTSNTLTFNITGNICQYPYTNCYGSVNIQYLSPSSGSVGTTVTVTGNGFSTTGNTVRFGAGVITGVNSPNGNTLSFVIPSQLGGTSQFVTQGTYNVSVSNFSGQTSNALTFNVTSSNSSGAPTITSVNGPTSLALNTQGTWTIQINNNQTNSYTTTSVNWGDQYISGAQLSANQTTYAQGNQTLTFTHSYSQSGTYTITFTVTGVDGLSNTSTITVVVGSTSSGSVTLSSLNPTTGAVGTQVILQGTGFSALDNTVHFGIGGTKHIPSSNNTTLYFTIPSYVSPCDVVSSGNACSPYSQQVTGGSYPIYVTNKIGRASCRERV